MTTWRNRRRNGRARRVALLAAWTAVRACVAASAATLDLAGPGKAFEPAGLDADAVVCEVPWALVNPADSDSRYAPLPDWSPWRSTDGDVLEVVAEVEAGASNAARLSLRGKDSALSVLRIRWSADATVLLVK